MPFATRLPARLASLLVLLLVGACASSPPTPADWVRLVEVLGSEEYAETLLDELDDRLDEADLDLRRDQHHALYDVLYEGAETQRGLLLRLAEVPDADRAAVEAQIAASRARIDADAEAVLDDPQIPVYRALQAEVRAALQREVRPG